MDSGKDVPYLGGMIHSRISSKAQTTIPKAVREALRLKDGDEVRYEIEGERAILSKVEEPDGFTADFSTFTEWASEADRVYDSLDASGTRR